MTKTDKTSPVLDPAMMDATVKPTDDFYRYTNGTWLKNHAIPADRPSDGPFYALRDQSEKQVRDILNEVLTEATNANESKFAALYSQFLDEATVNAAGVEPLSEDLALLAQTPSLTDLAQAMGKLQRTGVGGMMSALVDADMNDPERYALFLFQSGLGLPDESYYREERYSGIRASYVKFLNTLATLLKASENSLIPQSLRNLDSDFGTRVLDFETRIASHHWDNVSTRDAVKGNNPLLLKELVEGYPNFPWKEWLSALQFEPTPDLRMNLRQPSFATGLTEIWCEDNRADIMLWLIARVLTARAPYLTDDFVQAQFEFSRTLTGATQIRPRWKRAIAFIEGAMGEALGRAYVERHFPAEYKEQMQHLVDNLIEAYRHSISSLDWMSEETKVKALNKLSQFTPKIGYPDQWRDYSSLQVGDDLIASVRHATAFELDRSIQKLDKPVDRTEWFMSPQTVNAYYNPLMNEIVFPAAILQPPFFAPNESDAVNYGAIGAVIGHEIGHGFDDQGAQYDGVGLLRNWWTDADRAEFENRTKRLIDQYNAYSPAQLDDDYTVNGALTIGENIGDLGGLSIAWKAYQIALQERGIDSPRDDQCGDLTGAEAFFYSWARIWRSKSRDEYAIQLLAIAPHSPAEFRCNGVLRNMDVFHEVFGTTESDGMWLPPEQRVEIW
ncbi:MAG: M13-type metalloendopeptidase [Actinomycetaceae bacterium]|nr:M13-type metalloendopeptidase [Actinomycetaceae bacterium]